MNKLIKTGNDRYDIVNEAGTAIAYVVKRGMGTHGHWRGWEHSLPCPDPKKVLWAEPEWLPNLTEVRKCYGIES